MSGEMNPVIHFDMPVEDRQRARAFYENAFGWRTTQLGPEMGDYVLVSTIESDPETRMPTKRGAINGGLYQRTAPDEGTRLTILVDDIREAMSRVQAAGGQVLGEPMELPGVGLFVSFTDTEGNIVTLDQDFTVQHL